MPQLFHQRLTVHSDFVIKFKSLAENALRHKQSSNKLKVVAEREGTKLYSFDYNTSTGMYFTLRDGQINFLHVWKKVSLKGCPQATEALAFRFGSRVLDFTLKEIFFEHLLPRFKLVFSDVEYTEDGKRWFEGQYGSAFTYPAKFDIYLLDLDTDIFAAVDREKGRTATEFVTSLQKYWRSSELYKRYRFAIKLK
jgi:hypothetical protein